MHPNRSDRALRRGLPALAVAAGLACALLQSACLLPVRHAPAASGRVGDRETGRPVAGALVVIRFEAWYDDVLPDRELLGHREVRTDASGHFRAGPLNRPGFAFWPGLRTGARVVGVMAEGYRCPDPQSPARSEALALDRAQHVSERRASCRPLAAAPGEAEAYASAWRELFPDRPRAQSRRERRELEQLLAARAAFGFGANCEGPVRDLSLSPTGRHAALVVESDGRARIQVADLEAPGVAVQTLAEVAPTASQRIAWSSARELVLWEPATRAQRLLSGSLFAGGGFQVVWTAPETAAPPASLQPLGGAPRSPLEPSELNDEGDSRWLGRSFAMRREIEPRSGLALDRLVVTRPEGGQREIDLPGEPCGPAGRFGRPHYRISSDASRGIDLRFVGGGCRAVTIDLETGDATAIGAGGRARCRTARGVPASQLQLGLRGYSREVTRALGQAGADTSTAYTLVIDAQGRTVAHSRDLLGRKYSASVPAFPVSTPLRRIDVGVAAGREPAIPAPAPPSGPSPL